MPKPPLHDLPPDYCGRILNEDHSQALVEELNKQISACISFEQLNLPIFPYIAAWHISKKGIWYEYVSPKFLDLFDTEAENIATVFSNAILDRHEYNKETSLLPEIGESTLKSEEIASQRDLLREKSMQKGIVEAVYKVSIAGGKEIWLKDFASISSWPEDSVYLSPGYLTDVSKEMQMKNQIDELNQLVNRDKNLLVEAERHATIGQVSAKVFHEIRNPIVSIGGMARRLVEKPTANDLNLKYVEVIAKEAARLEKVLNNLFHFTKNVDLDLKLIDPLDLVKNVLGLLRSDLNAFHIHVSLKISGKIKSILADRDQLQIALVQIINNSIEAMNKGGELSIALEMKNGSMFFSIRDTGIGIRTINRKKITEPFFSTKIYGTGLGLSLAEKAIQLHNGTLSINRLQSGSTEAILQLPV